jgi:magnesium-transporting ATPase (P-type)
MVSDMLSWRLFVAETSPFLGPPSQSLGVDPVDPAVMRRPPRKKNEPIITKQLLYRVLFSAAMIVLGTLCVYYIALGDDHVSRREQTMVCGYLSLLVTVR